MGDATSWDPQVYLQFADERARPFHDLVARIRRPAGDPGVRRVVDLGCGPGGLTAQLAARWPTAEVVGLDSSAAMIERAGMRVAGRLRFEQADLREWRPEQPVDVIVTNATLQWVPGHLDLLPGWVADALAPDGWLALQVPGNWGDPMHVILDALCRSDSWASLLAGTVRDRLDAPDPAAYLDVLAGTGATVDAWETTYHHVLDPDGRFGPDAALAWASGTALRPALDALDALPDKGIREEFLAEYGAALRSAYPRQPWGTVLPFRRVFAVAHRA